MLCQRELKNRAASFKVISSREKNLASGLTPTAATKKAGEMPACRARTN
jgi:hypothetical protein